MHEQFSNLPTEPLGVFGKDDFLSELARESPEYAHRRLLEHSSPADYNHFVQMEEGKYVFALIDLPYLGQQDMRVGKTRFDPDINAHGHADLTWGFKIWTAGEIILEKIRQPDGSFAFDITLTSRSGTYMPENERLVFAAQWFLESGLPIARLRLADYQRNVFAEY